MTAPPSRLHVRLLPATRTGWGSLACGGLSLVARFTVQALPDVGPTLLMMLFGFFGFAFLGAILGVVALVRSRERALVLGLPILYGVVLAGFLAGEFVNPH